MPPIVKLLTKQLPLLRGRLTFGGHVKPPPQSIRRRLERALERRNAIVHRGEQTPSDHELDEYLDAIRDTLGLCDYYCGQAWALDYLSANIRAELRTDAADSRGN